MTALAQIDADFRSILRADHADEWAMARYFMVYQFARQVAAVDGFAAYLHAGDDVLVGLMLRLFRDPRKCLRITRNADMLLSGDVRYAFALIAETDAATVTRACEYFQPRMQPGGVMMFDDYGSSPATKAAVDGFFRDRADVPCYLATGQAVVTKLQERTGV